MNKVYTITGARLYFESGRTKNLRFTAITTDLEALRKKIKTRNRAKVVRLTFEEPYEDTI